MSDPADPAASPGGGRWLPYAAVHETHSAVVVLLDGLALKVKKPVDLGFLDFTTREQRQEVCRHEVQLNRRMAPDVYLGVSDVLDPAGRLAEHLVVMRRMPEDRRLTALVLAGTDVRGELTEIARVVALFHDRADRSPAIARAGTAEALRRRWDSNFRGLDPFLGTVVEAETATTAEDLVQRYLAGRGPLLDARIRSGAVLDGHGDLLADDIFCLADGPRILDCLEFDDQLRHLDQIDDAAFLAMDLERLGARELAEHFLAAYLAASRSDPPTSLIDHYIAYRAVVRAKVACLRAAQGVAEAGTKAQELMDIAGAHLRAARVRLILVGGAPGTGKSTLAEELAEARGYVVISSDRVRKEQAGVTPETSMAAGFGEGIYTAERTAGTYAEMLLRAGVLLAQGRSVVLDATWSDATQRRAAAELATRTRADLALFECRLDQATAAQRIAHRNGVSDADRFTASAMREVFAPWPEAQPVDTAESSGSCRQLVLDLLDR